MELATAILYGLKEMNLNEAEVIRLECLPEQTIVGFLIAEVEVNFTLNRDAEYVITSMVHQGHTFTDPTVLMQYESWVEFMANAVLSVAQLVQEEVEEALEESGIDMDAALTQKQALPAGVNTENLSIDAAFHVSVDPKNPDGSWKEAFSKTDETLAHVNFLLSDEMIAFENAHPLSDEQYGYLAIGAILLSANSESCSVLENYYMDRKEPEEGLRSSWGVVDHASAIETLARLSEESDYIKEVNEDYQEIMDSDNPMSFPAYAEAYEFLISLGYHHHEIVSIRNLAAWNYGRAGYVAKFSHHLGYISEAEVWHYLKVAAIATNRTYSSLREFLAAYMIGRSIGFGGDLAWWRDICAYLLYHQKSPWNDWNQLG